MPRLLLTLTLGLGLLPGCTTGPSGTDASAVDAGADGTRRDGGRPDAGPRPGPDGGLDAGVDLGPPVVPPGGATFVDVAAEAGLVAPQSSAEDPCRYAFEAFECWIPMFTGGIAIGDVDEDGWPDVYLTSLDRPGTLYRNRGDGTFADITTDVGLDAVDAPTNGAVFVDVDRDGDLDLYLTVVPGPAIRTSHYLWIQGDDGTFADETAARGAGIDTGLPHGGTSIAVGDYDRDGYPDLHVNEWLRRALARAPHTRLLHNRGDACPGCFEDRTREAGVATVPDRCWEGRAECDIVSFSSAFADFDEDGWPDLAVVRDYGGSQFFWNQGDGTFLEDTVAAGVGTDENGMGSTLGDVDGDGRLDWFVSSIGDTGDLCGDQPCVTGTTGNRLYVYAGERRFEDATDRAAVRHGGWGWGTALFDFDNDGDLDLILANGMDRPLEMGLGEWTRDPMRFWTNDGAGAFVDESERRGIDEREVGTGLAVFDYDRDGDQDVLMARNHGRPALYRNDGGNGRPWLRVRLEATRSAPEGIGARIRLTPAGGGPPQVRLLDSVTHYLGQSERVAHFGLGDAERVAEVEVTWPSGRVSRLRDVRARQELRIVEGR